MQKLLLGLLSFFFLVVPVYAQDVNSDQVASDSTLKTELIWQKERLDQEIEVLKSTYQTQLENYLYQEKLYKIAYDQYEQLQTLSSIEDLTQKAKTLGLSRDEVLTSYLDLLRLNLIATEGIELSLKTKYLDQLEASIVSLKNHSENLGTLNDRDQVLASLASFATEQKDLRKQAQEVLVLLAVGNLQMIYDKSTVLKSDIDNYLQTKGTLDLPNISRASDETNRSLGSAKMKLDVFWAETLKRNTSNWYLAGLYNDLPKTLNPMYVNLSQSISYLNELLDI
jgi:hypothetical protein